ncbi:hypothetical protein F2P81_008381 [Scophthalmus maximus]|uniref:Uncharacterized protein n=1 Tax=Scophthalmus maximus TaxID=52904 RepID=A0A6A4SY37_SCOMX|nr:hypothetical protein F2P81_008381 [Scophthalmus maximus]
MNGARLLQDELQEALTLACGTFIAVGYKNQQHNVVMITTSVPSPVIAVEPGAKGHVGGSSPRVLSSVFTVLSDAPAGRWIERDTCLVHVQPVVNPESDESPCTFPNETLPIPDVAVTRQDPTTLTCSYPTDQDIASVWDSFPEVAPASDQLRADANEEKFRSTRINHNCT